MGITLKIDISKVEAKLNKATKDIEETVKKELTIFALNTARDAQRLAPVDEGFLKRAIQPVLPTTRPLKASVIVAANYAAYIEFGTRSFAAAYVSSLPPSWQTYAAKFKGSTGGSYDDFILRLMGWMKRKGIDEKLSYVYARKIMRYGSPAKPFLYPATIKNFEELKKRLKA